jgi:hypothetical protein
VLLGSGGAYSLTFSHFVPAGRQQRVDASVLLQDVGPGRTVAGRREFFGGLYRYRNTRVRGHRGLLLRARYSPVRSLVWREQGRLYELSTNTPGKISTGALRAIAAGLQHLRGAYTGQAVGAGGGAQAQALLGDRAVNLSVSWTAPCTGAGGQAAPVRGATAKVGWLALGAGGAFGRAPVAVAPQGPGAPWSLSVSGSVAVAGGQGTFQASSPAAAESCGIGPLALQLARLPRLRRGT